MKFLDLGFTKQRADQPAFVNQLKIGIWIYYFLLIFEGALRKWVLPGLATPLLIIRDPVVIILLMIALKHRVLRLNGYLLVITLIGILSFILAIVAGHGNLYIALYGLRILLLHFPLMFVMQKIFTRDDILNMGKMTLFLAIPMAIKLQGN